MTGSVVVKLLHLPVARSDGSNSREWFVTIDGRQALHEGPRAVGRCVYCNGPCTGATRDCERRVFGDRMQGQR